MQSIARDCGFKAYSTGSEPVNLVSRLDDPMLMPNAPAGTTQFWLATSQ